jgi:hypothetical protein
MSTANHISSFVQMQGDERFDREFYITHSSLHRYSIRMIVAFVLWLLVVIFFVLMTMLNDFPAGPLICLLIVFIPGLIAVLYYCLRKLRISYGYATVTNRRVLYYEFNTHPAENYHAVKSLYLSDITAMRFRVERGFFKKSFVMALYTESKAMAVGAVGWLGWLKLFGRGDRLEPGPDAMTFIEYLSGQVALGQFQPETASKADLAFATTDGNGNGSTKPAEV